LGLTVATEGASFAATEARSMMAGAVAFTAYASCVSWVMMHYKLKAASLSEFSMNPKRTQHPVEDRSLSIEEVRIVKGLGSNPAR